MAYRWRRKEDGGFSTKVLAIYLLWRLSLSQVPAKDPLERLKETYPTATERIARGEPRDDSISSFAEHHFASQDAHLDPSSLADFTPRVPLVAEPSMLSHTMAKPSPAPIASHPISRAFGPFAHLAYDEQSARLLSTNTPPLPLAADPVESVLDGLRLAADAAVARAAAREASTIDPATSMRLRREVGLDFARTRNYVCPTHTLFMSVYRNVCTASLL